MPDQVVEDCEADRRVRPNPGYIGPVRGAEVDGLRLGSEPGEPPLPPRDEPRAERGIRDVLLLDVVEAHGRSHLQGRRRLVAEVDTGNPVRLVVVEIELQDQFVPVLRVVSAAPQDVHHEALGLAPVGDPVHLPPAEVVVESDGDGGSGGKGSVRPHRPFPGLLVRRQDALVTKPAARQEVGQLFPPPPGRQAVFLEIAPVQPLVEENPLGLGAVGVEPGFRRSSIRPPLAWKAGHALRDLRVPDGNALLYTGPGLGEDLDHAPGGLGAVQRGSGRPLDDLDAGNVLRVDVVQGRTPLTWRARGREAWERP